MEQETLRRLIPVVLMMAWFGTAPAQTPAPLGSVRAIHNLTNEEASRALPVAFQGTVTFSRSYEQTLFVEDDGVGLFVQTPANVGVNAGDRVLVRGKTHNSFRPEIIASQIAVTGHGALPQPIAATFDQMSGGELDSMLATVRGTVRTADIATNVSSGDRSIVLGLLIDGGLVAVNLNSDDAGTLSRLLDAEVEVTGVVSGTFDGKNQLTGIELNVPSIEGIKILKPAAVSAWSLPVTDMGEILAKYHEVSGTQRTLAHGTITYYQPGSMAVLQGGGQSLRVTTRSNDPVGIGDEADATGFPDLVNGFLTLGNAEIKDSHRQAPVEPLRASWEQLSASEHAFDLVSVEGELVMESRGAVQDEYQLNSDGHPVSVIYQHPGPGSLVPLAAMKDIPLRTRVRVTGICIPYSANPFNGPVPFEILVQSPDDIATVATPPWLNVRHLVMVVGLLLLAVFAAGARAWLVERRARRQIAGMAYLEKRRAAILEQISAAKPLAEILESVTELVSASLEGAPCWCQVTDGARLGNCPPDLASGTLRVVEWPIPSHTGTRLGSVFAAFDARTGARDAEKEALGLAAGLATLAIETSRLYSDLVHRSEFDLLTDVRNRFSLGKFLDTQIEAARQSAGIFGLLYLDLDNFKAVNDELGHHIGDLFLQQVAGRMKHVLRPADMLARLGGDEFASVATQVHSRRDVEEIGARLERCFDEPFEVDGRDLRGAVSIGIAMYPEDGASKDALLKAADAAMYGSKNRRSAAAK